VDQQAVDGAFVIFITLPAIKVLSRVLEGVLYAIDLVAQPVSLIATLCRVGRNHLEIAIVEFD